ncbi:uncharacterized protein LOC117106962 [Anneissia japonica]|uniref:uncharacterized protein LOC117106962 n=1 Tax=Anneissia japonica TaxID=1529436 RepID=UPI001425B893|nr:uncharacterized protein LOC117106962 [Anneissia japonica]
MHTQNLTENFKIQRCLQERNDARSRTTVASDHQVLRFLRSGNIGSARRRQTQGHRTVPDRRTQVQRRELGHRAEGNGQADAVRVSQQGNLPNRFESDWSPQCSYVE